MLVLVEVLVKVHETMLLASQVILKGVAREFTDNNSDNSVCTPYYY